MVGAKIHHRFAGEEAARKLRARIRGANDCQGGFAREGEQPPRQSLRSETEDAFGDDDEEEDAAADATGSDGGRPAAPKRATRSLFKRVFGMAAFKTAAASPARPSSSSAEDEREKLARLMGERR